MSKSFKFRYVNEIVGAFILIVVFALLAGVILAGKAQGWFARDYTLTTTFPPEGASGVQEGSEVRILGALAGTVSDVAPGGSGELVGTLVIKERFFRLILSDSVATFKKKLAVGGDSFIEISRGNSGSSLEDFAAIPFKKEDDLLETVMQVVQDVQSRLNPILEKVAQTLDEYRDLGANMNDPEQAMQQMISSLSRIVNDIEKGEGAIGKLLRDEEVATQISAMLESARDTLAEVEAAAEQLPEISRGVEDSVDQVPDLISQAEMLVFEIDRLVRGLQQNWLVRKHIDKEEGPSLVPPSAISGAGGDK